MLLRLPLFPHDLRGYYTERLFSKSHQWGLRLETQSFASFDHLIDSLPGYVRLYGTNVAADLPFAYQGGSVVWCVWIPPWALDVLHSCSYLQLDASFREIRPYVYSIPLGIRANESFPLAVVFGLVESFELYQLFEEAMLKPGVARDVLNQKPILSDQHPSLMSIGFDRRHFWCLRHLVEKFGAKSYLGEMTSRLTF
jgi:hypothetical protein